LSSVTAHAAAIASAPAFAAAAAAAAGLAVITCDQQPSVAESWNAMFQTFKSEPWGVYMARDTFWEPGAMQKLSAHSWRATQTGDVELGHVSW
jgi:hypothetical protein